MKIVYGITCTKNENIFIFLKNVKKINCYFNHTKFILNTNKKCFNHNNVKLINAVGDIVESRTNLLNEMSLINADAWLVFDADIEITDNALTKLSSLLSNGSKYDFISFYYKQDPPIPIFFTLSSSLTDFYWQKKNLSGYKEFFFDDSLLNSSVYQSPTKLKSNKLLKAILLGKSYARDINEFKKEIDENSCTTGGATIYFNKKALIHHFPWKKWKDKSLIWYDSFRTFKLKEMGFNYARIPVFVLHHRNRLLNLEWDTVVRYIEGYNLYMNAKDKNYNLQSMYCHSMELYFYIKGMIKKIVQLNLTAEELIVINKIKKFLQHKDNIFEK